MTSSYASTKSVLKIALVGSAVTLALAGCTSSIGAAKTTYGGPQSDTALTWGPCAELEESIQNIDAAVGTPLGFEEYLPQLECTTVSVPLDYEDPTGRQIDIAISRTLPSNGSSKILLTNPGGPGLEGRTMPAVLLGSPLSEISNNVVVVGIDVRGTGASSPLDCPAVAAISPLDENGNEISEQDYTKNLVTANQECFDSDPEYFKQITTQNAAKDLDRVREALGADKTDFLAGSWGTELGMSYLDQFPDNTDRMLLDSISDPVPNASEIYRTVAAAIKRNQEQNLGQADPSELNEDELEEDGFEHDSAQSDGFTSEDEAQSEAAMSGDVGNDIPSGPLFQPLSFTARLAYTCNGVTGAADEKIALEAQQEYSEDIGGENERIAHPVSSDTPGVPACAGWPNEPTPIQVTTSSADVQLIGHEYETVTPVEWAKKAHELIGGNLIIIDDDVHASALSGPYAPQVVRFILDGIPMTVEQAQSGQAQSEDTVQSENFPQSEDDTQPTD